MKLPSLHHLLAETARVARRFPLTLLCALVLCGVGIYIQRLDFRQQQDLEWLFPALSAAGLGLTLTLSVDLAAERYRWPLGLRVLVQAGAVGLLGLWYGLCPAEPTLVWGLRLFLLLVGLHLLVAVVPYLPELRRQADTPGFWRYNETLFLRILTGGLYSGVLFVGCALALLAIDNLFEVHLDERWYPHLFTVLATVFNTWFFLAGVPQDFAALETAAPYPRGLKVFTQFVLLPLVVLYLAILYAYLARIIGQWTLPKGWVSILILALAVAGIFALLLIHPIRDNAENTWIRTFARWFYRALFPLLGLLAVAIGTRIHQYGITEERYLVLVLAAWLALIATYFLVRQGRGIIWIPASLAAVAFLAAGGPWGAFAVAERSQLAQLRELATQHKLLQAGKLDGASQRVPNLPAPVRQRLTSSFEFFADRDNLAAVQPLFAASLALPDSLRRPARRQKSRPSEARLEWAQRRWTQERLFDVSGISRTSYSEVDGKQELTAEFHSKPPQAQPVGPGRYWLGNLRQESYRFGPGDTLAAFTVPQGQFRLHTAGRGGLLRLEQRAGSGWQLRLQASISSLADSLARRHGANPSQGVVLPAGGFALRASAQDLTLHLFLSDVTRRQHQDTVRYGFEGNALLEFTPSNLTQKPPAK
ncbi:DUF4153 domain-containing protein [Hymenobacter weizhouensis]|uniref:DUF4153 domain-containing protein n=1 Tax=Hymenobacter sp. YIM 151500-1 TaxID=2987689 RepID=UPI002225C384|nr:DUF4153 domain-containing protein [Hymenobacter sp. YIM 151500-1]UYZ64551.1 DUF4153 domain-containing protein [Hymenobacter sp. YIM 151500-1]